MPKVAVVSSSRQDCGGYDCSCATIIESITDWKEVTQQEAEALRKYCDKQRDNRFLLTQYEITPFLLENVMEEMRKEAAKEEAARAKRERELAARRKALEAKKEQKRLKDFEKIKKEYEAALRMKEAKNGKVD